MGGVLFDLATRMTNQYRVQRNQRKNSRYTAETGDNWYPTGQLLPLLYAMGGRQLS